MTNESNQIPLSQIQIQSWSERNHAEYVEGESLVEMVHEDLMARRISIDGCRDIIQYLRDQDAPTCHRLEGILSVKGQRAGDAANRVARIPADIERKNARTRSP
jgi:bacterioferritin